MNNFTLAIPLYNEEKNLENLFRALLNSHLIQEKNCKYINSESSKINKNHLYFINLDPNL